MPVLVDAIGSFETVLADLSKRSAPSRSPKPVRHSSGLVLEQTFPTVAAVAPLAALESAPVLGAGAQPGPELLWASVTSTPPSATFLPSTLPSIAKLPATIVGPPGQPDAAAAVAESWDDAFNRIKGQSTMPLSHGWDTIIADISKHGYSRAELAHGWSEIVDAINISGRGPKFKLGFGWDEVVATINAETSGAVGDGLRATAERTDFGWAAIVSKVNSEFKGRV
jgi:hypothetical protein